MGGEERRKKAREGEHGEKHEKGASSSNWGGFRGLAIGASSVHLPLYRPSLHLEGTGFRRSQSEPKPGFLWGVQRGR